MGNPFERDWTAPADSQSIPQSKNPAKYADITIVIDRSASMVAMQDGVVDGFNEFVGRMKKTPGDNRWTMVQFDDPNSARGANEDFPNVMFENAKENEVPYLTLASKEERQPGLNIASAWSITASNEETKPIPENAQTCKYNPRGGTALVDAVCLSMRRTSARISGREDQIKPVLMVITDGEENASREFGSDKMREMIARRDAKGWSFLYIGANQDAWANANAYKMANITSYSQSHTYGGSVLSGAVASGACNSFSFAANSAGVRQAIASGMIGLADVASGACYNSSPAQVQVDWSATVKLTSE